MLSCTSTYRRTESETPGSLEMVGIIDHRVVPIIACTTQQPLTIWSKSVVSAIYFGHRNDSIIK